MPDPILYCKAIGIAALVSTIVVLAMLLVGRKVVTMPLNTACAIAIGLGLTSGYYVLSLQLRWPPVSGLDRLLTIVVPLTLCIELIAGFQSIPRRVAWLLRLGLAFTIPRILLHGSVYLSDSDDWTRWQSLIVMAVCGALLAVLWGLLSWLFRRSPGVSIPLSLCLTIQCAGTAVMMAGYIKGGSAAFPLASTLMATSLIASLGVKCIIGIAKFDASVILGVGVVGLFGVVFVGNAFGRISTPSALTMLLAPLLCWSSEVPLLKNRDPWLVGSIRLGLVSLPLIVVLVLAKRDFDRNMSPLVISSFTERFSHQIPDTIGRRSSCDAPDTSRIHASTATTYPTMLNNLQQRSAAALTFVTLLIASAGHANAQARRPQRLPDNVTVTRDIAYVPNGHERQKLDLYIPKLNDNQMPPLVVWIHGGGWAKGSKSGIGNCGWVLEEGYALASVGYRLTDVASFPAQLDDCKAAVRWLKKNAASYGCDPKRIVVWGSSAGGHLVSMLGTTGQPNDPSDDIQGVIDWFGPSELLTMQKQRTLPVNLDADASDSFESKLVGGALQENPGKANAASPVTHVTADDAPFLIMHGDRDPLVSLTQSLTLYQKLKNAGVPAKIHVIEGAGHGGREFQSEDSRNLIRKFLKKQLQS